MNSSTNCGKVCGDVVLESRGYEVPHELRLREKFTGMESIYERSVLIRARELVSSGRVQAMSCYDTDRLARDPRELISRARRRRLGEQLAQVSEGVMRSRDAGGVATHRIYHPE